MSKAYIKHICSKCNVEVNVSDYCNSWESGIRFRCPVCNYSEDWPNG